MSLSQTFKNFKLEHSFLSFDTNRILQVFRLISDLFKCVLTKINVVILFDALNF